MSLLCVHPKRVENVFVVCNKPSVETIEGNPLCRLHKPIFLKEGGREKMEKLLKKVKVSHPVSIYEVKEETPKDEEEESKPEPDQSTSVEKEESAPADGLNASERTLMRKLEAIPQDDPEEKKTKSKSKGKGKETPSQSSGEPKVDESPNTTPRKGDSMNIMNTVAFTIIGIYENLVTANIANVSGLTQNLYAMPAFHNVLQEVLDDLDVESYIDSQDPYLKFFGTIGICTFNAYSQNKQRSNTSTAPTRPVSEDELRNMADAL